MKLQVLALLLSTAHSASAQAVVRTQTSKWTYEVKANTVAKISRATGTVIWRKSYAYKSLELIDAKEDALVIVGMENKKYLGRNASDDIYQTALLPAIFVVKAENGSLLWKSSELNFYDTKVFGVVLVYKVDNSLFASSSTKIVDRLDGTKLADFRELSFASQKRIVSLGMPFPSFFGNGSHSDITLDFMNLPSKQVEHYKITLPAIGKCETVTEYDSSNLLYKITDTIHEYLYQTTCGFGYARYTWAAGPKQTPVVKGVPKMEWPKTP